MTPAAQSIDASSVSFTMGTTSQTQDSKQSSLLFTRSAMRSHLGNPLRVSSDSTSKTVTSVDLSEEDTRRHEVLKLKRRFLRSREASNAYFAKSEIRKKSMREVGNIVTIVMYVVIFNWQLRKPKTYMYM